MHGPHPEQDVDEKDDDEDRRHGVDERGGPFSPRERRRLRDIMERDEKARWLAAMVRAWGAWLAAILVGFLAFSDGVKRIVKGWLA